jgi:hypothetical protein
MQLWAGQNGPDVKGGENMDLSNAVRGADYSLALIFYRC